MGTYSCDCGLWSVGTILQDVSIYIINKINSLLWKLTYVAAIIVLDKKIDTVSFLGEDWTVPITDNGVATIEAIEAAASYKILMWAEQLKYQFIGYDKKQQPSIDKWCYDTLYTQKTHNCQAISEVSGRKVANTRHRGCQVAR